MTKIISIHSFRGGTGKSNITANVAAQVAMQGHRVGIVDTDIQSPGVHVIFGLDEESMGHTLNDYLRGEKTMKEIAYSVGESESEEAGFQALAGKHLYLIPSSINRDEITKILKSGYDITTLNMGFKEFYTDFELDYLFLDTHPGLHENTVLAIALSDFSLIVMRPDQQDFQGTAVTIDIVRSLDVYNLALVVNKALSKYDFNQIKEQVSGEFDAPVAGALPLSEEMVDLGSKDIFSLRFPDDKWTKNLKEIADYVLKNT